MLFTKLFFLANKYFTKMQIETLIFFDFETTGLPNDNPSDPLLNINRCKEMPLERTIRLERLIHSDGSSKMPRITEMSFVCIPRPLFMAAIKQLDEKIPGESIFEHIQVAANIHTRQINPQLTPQEWTKYEEARLANPKCIQLKKSELEWKCNFGQEWPGVIQMLQICPKPACLIAHNGINFDFRLLYHEIRRTTVAADISQVKFPDQIYFLDSMHGLLDIESEYNRQTEIITENIDWQIILSQTQSKRQCLSSNEENQRIEPESTRTATASTTEVIVHSTTSSFCSGKTKLKEEKKKPDETDTDCVIISSSSTNKEEDGPQSLKRLNETERLQRTPKMKMESPAGSMGRSSVKRTLQFGDHPVDFMKESKWSPARKHRVERNRDFFQRNFDGEWRFNGHQARRALIARGNFRLESLHNRFFSTPTASHRAQSDSEALLQLCLAYGEDFLNYVDKNISAFPACFRKG